MSGWFFTLAIVTAGLASFSALKAAETLLLGQILPATIFAICAGINAAVSAINIVNYFKARGDA